LIFIKKIAIFINPGQHRFIGFDISGCSFWQKVTGHCNTVT